MILYHDRGDKGFWRIQCVRKPFFFLDVYDEFKDQLLMKMERGKLDKVVWTEKRELMRRRSGND